MHKRSIHVEADVDKVFNYVEDPRHFFNAFPEHERNHSTITDVTLTPEGTGSTYAWKSTMLLFHVEGVLVREEWIPNERIADHSSTGPVWTFTFEPDPKTLTLDQRRRCDRHGTAGDGSAGGSRNAGAAAKSTMSQGAAAAASRFVSGGRFHFSSISFSAEV